MAQISTCVAVRDGWKNYFLRQNGAHLPNHSSEIQALWDESGLFMKEIIQTSVLSCIYWWADVAAHSKVLTNFPSAYKKVGTHKAIGNKKQHN